MGTSIADHYEKHSAEDSYEGAWFYSDPAYQDFLVGEIGAELFGPGGAAGPRDRVVDVGCGTGKFSRLLFSGCKLHHPVYGLDPFLLKPQADPQMLSLPAVGAVEFAQRVEEFASAAAPAAPDDGPAVLNKVLLKEVVHHISDEFGEMCRHLAGYFRRAGHPDCTLLVATRSSDPAAYPFFAAAKEAWREGQEDAGVYARHMEDAGFDDVTCVRRSFRVEMSVDRWRAMVRNRFWSNFGGLSDEQIEAGLEAMGDFDEFLVEPGSSQLAFDDTFIFVVGRIGDAARGA